MTIPKTTEKKPPADELPAVEKPAPDITPPVTISTLPSAGCRVSTNHGYCRWNKVDTVLVIVAVAAILSAIGCYNALLPRWQPDPARHGPEDEPVAPSYVATTCTVEEVSLTGEELECDQNDAGEWCRMSPQGRHGGRGPRRLFPCLRVMVRPALTDAVPGLLHVDFIEAENFPTCTMSSCGSWANGNEANVRAHMRAWIQVQREGSEIECFVNENNSEEVLQESPSWRGILGTMGFHAVIWPLLLAKFCFWALLVRRLCHVCDGLHHDDKKVLPLMSQDKMAPYVMLGSELSTDDGESKSSLPDLQGMPGEIILVASVPPAYDDLSASAPPAYDEKPALALKENMLL